MNLTTEQKQALERGESVAITLDATECVVLRRDVYDRLSGYDADEWTEDELRALATRTFEDADHAGPIP